MNNDIMRMLGRECKDHPANREFENSISEHIAIEICIYEPQLIKAVHYISLEVNNILHLLEVLTYPRHHLLIEVIKMSPNCRQICRSMNIMIYIALYGGLCGNIK